MAATARFRKQVPTDVWSVKERLALASSVMKSGDQNWVSVSRAIKPFAEPHRPSDWFSQKNCALQYSDLLEKVETPKRKRSEKGEPNSNGGHETAGDLIVRKLTIERIEELKKIVQEEEKKYRSLKEEVDKVRAGHFDDNIKEHYEKVLQEKKQAEEAKEQAIKKAAEEAEARAAAQQARQPGKQVARKTPTIKTDDESTQDSISDSRTSIDDENSNQSSLSAAGGSENKPKSSVSPSPLLNTFLKNPAELKKAAQKGNTPRQHEDKVVIKEEPQEAAPQVSDDTEVEGKLSVTTKTEVPSSPATGAPTLSRLLGTPFSVSKESATPSPAIPSQPKTAKGANVPDPTHKSGKASIKKDAPPPVKEELPDLAPDATLEKVVSVDDDPLSPASSVLSEVEGGTTPSLGKSSSRRHSRDTKAKSSRRSTRVTRGRLGEEKEEGGKKVSKPSEPDSSDEDVAVESDDTASMMTTKPFTTIESVPNSPAMSHCSDTEDEKAHKVWKKSIMLVWRAAAIHKYANVFLHPVTEDIAPGYRGIVYRPMDLSSIKKNIENGMIRTTAEFQRDMMLMFTNAIMYNNSDQDIYQMAEEMYTDVMAHIEQYVNTQIMVQSEPKVLRMSRRSEVMSDKEDDPKKRRVSSDQEHGGKSKKRKP